MYLNALSIIMLEEGKPLPVPVPEGTYDPYVPKLGDLQWM